MRKQLWSYAGTIVPHTDHGLVALSVYSHPNQAARVGVLRGVIEQIHNNLLHSSRVRLYPNWFRGKRNRKVMSACVHKGAGSLGGMVNDDTQFRLFFGKPQFSLRDPADVE